LPTVVRNKPHLHPLRESHEKEYIWPLIEQIRAHDEKWIEVRKRLRAQWLAKREAAREKKRQSLDPTILSYSTSPPASGSVQGLGEFLEDIDPAQSAWKAGICSETAQTRHASISSRAARIGVNID
jgi:hypothetical protein